MIIELVDAEYHIRHNTIRPKQWNWLCEQIKAQGPFDGAGQFGLDCFGLIVDVKVCHETKVLVSLRRAS